MRWSRCSPSPSVSRGRWRRVAGWPLPTTWPHLDRLPDVLRDGLSDGFWVKAIALVVWLAWAQVIVAVGAEVVARVRGRSSDRRRGLGWAQAVAGQLVGALAVAGGLVGSAPHAVAAPAPSLASTLVAVAGPTPARHRRRRRRWRWPRRCSTSSCGASRCRRSLGTSSARPRRGRRSGTPTRVASSASGSSTIPNLILPGWDLAVPQPAVLIPPLVLSAADEHVPAGPMPVVAPPSRRPRRRRARRPRPTRPSPRRRRHRATAVGGWRRGRSGQLGRSGRAGAGRRPGRSWACSSAPRSSPPARRG